MIAIRVGSVAGAVARHSRMSLSSGRGDGLFGRIGRSEDHTKQHHRDDDERADRADGEGEEGSGSIDAKRMTAADPSREIRRKHDWGRWQRRTEKASPAG